MHNAKQAKKWSGFIWTDWTGSYVTVHMWNKYQFLPVEGVWYIFYLYVDFSPPPGGEIWHWQAPPLLSQKNWAVWCIVNTPRPMVECEKCHPHTRVEKSIAYTDIIALRLNRLGSAAVSGLGYYLATYEGDVRTFDSTVLVRARGVRHVV